MSLVKTLRLGGRIQGSEGLILSTERLPPPLDGSTAGEGRVQHAERGQRAERRERDVKEGGEGGGEKHNASTWFGACFRF